MKQVAFAKPRFTPVFLQMYFDFNLDIRFKQNLHGHISCASTV